MAGTICHNPTAFEVRRRLFERDVMGAAAAVAVPPLFAVIAMMTLVGRRLDRAASRAL